MEKLYWLAYLVLFFSLLGIAEAANCGNIKTCDCGDTLMTSYTLSAADSVTTMQCTGNGLTIGADNIVLDCDGRAIRGTQGSGTGIRVQQKQGINVKNCIVHTFYVGIDMSESDSSMLNNNVLYDSGTGILLESYTIKNTLIDNIAYNNTQGVYLSYSSNNTLIGNVAYNNSDDGIVVVYSNNNALIRNVAYNNSDNGIAVVYSNNNTLSGNAAYDNSHHGIAVAGTFGDICSNNTLTDNIANNNLVAGIMFDFSSNNTLKSNEFCYNGNWDIWGDIEQGDSDYGSNNICDITHAWNDEGTTKCTHPCSSDNTPPVITFTGTAPNVNGWNKGDVTVSWSVTDPESAITSKSGCDTATVTTETSGTDYTCTATSAGGTISKTISVKIDKTAPTISATAKNVDGSAYVSNTWTNQDVSVQFTCADTGGSGVFAQGGCPAGVSYTTEGIRGITATATDNAGNTAYVLFYVNIDKTSPSVTISAPANGATYNIGQVVASDYGCDGRISGTVSCTGTVAKGANMDTASEGSKSFTVNVADKAGNTNSKTVSYTVVNPDSTAPVIAKVITGTPGTNGWYTSDITVSWTVIDEESTISSQSGCDPTTITSDTSGITLTCSATSAGGTNSQSATIKRDATAPTVTLTADRPADSNGWYNHAVTFTVNGADATADSVSCDSPISYGGPDSASVSVTGYCTDDAGNEGSTASTFKYDATAPAITFVSRTPANANGWNNGGVTSTWTCSDVLSGPVAGSTSRTVTSEGTSQSATGTCSDKAGNTASDTQTGINIDKTAPTFDPCPTVGPFLLNSGSQSVAIGVDGAISGLNADASALSGLVDTSSVGQKSVTFTAKDKAGNTNIKTCSYSVIYATGAMCLGSTGRQILQPVNADGTSVFKQKSTVPAKFRVCDANGVSIGTAGVITSFKNTAITTESSIAVVNEDVISTTPDTAFRWSSTDQQWIYNIDTKSLAAGKIYGYTITLNDGSTIPFQFGLK